MSPDMIDAMIAAGLTREQMAALIKVELAKEQAKKEARRAGNAERQRRFKERKSNALPALSDVTEALPSVTASRDIQNAPTHAEPEPNKTTSSPVQKDILSNIPKVGIEKPNCDDLGFAEVWSAYPRRQGGNSRKNAEARYRKAVKSGCDPESIITGVRAYAAHCDATGKTGTEFVKTTETWLNGRFWESDWSVSQSRAPPHRQARRNTALDGLDELERRYANVQPHPTLRLSG